MELFYPIFYFLYANRMKNEKKTAAENIFNIKN